MRILITGFEPIWGVKKTPSGDFAKLWQDGSLSIAGVEIKSLVLPQVYGKSTDIVVGEIAAWHPHAVLMFGATQHNDPLRLERFAINCEKTPMGDNTRIPIKDRPVVRGGPSAYESTLPVHRLVEHLNEMGIWSKASYKAGTHTCNSLMYGVLHWLATHETPHRIVAGFMHVSFPNEYGVIEDALWSTATFEGIVKAGLVLTEKVRDWYLQTQMGQDSSLSNISMKKATR